MSTNVHVPVCTDNPREQVLAADARCMQLAKVLRILRIMKMLKLLRLPRIFSTLRAVVGKAFISMIMLIFGILMVWPLIDSSSSSVVLQFGELAVLLFAWHHWQALVVGHTPGRYPLLLHCK